MFFVKNIFSSYAFSSDTSNNFPFFIWKKVKSEFFFSLPFSSSYTGIFIKYLPSLVSSSSSIDVYSYLPVLLLKILLQIYLLNIFINELEKTFDIIEFIKNYIKIKQFNREEFVHNELIICKIPKELSYPSAFTKIFNTDMFTAKDTNQYLKLKKWQEKHKATHI